MKKILHGMKFIFVFFIIFIASCASVKDQSIKSEGAKYNLAIASDLSDFKEQVYQKLIEKYKSQASIDLMSLQKLKGIDPKNYNAILILDTCIAGSPSSPDFQTFANSIEDKKKVILFVTTNTSSWKYSYSGIDAITSASNKANLEKIVAELSEKIDRILTEK